MTTKQLRWVFFLGLGIKLAALPWFRSYYLNDLFIPFLDAAVKSPWVNPWNLSPPSYFPYGSVLFFILFLPRYLFYLVFGDAVLGQTLASICLVKVPILGLDIFLFYSLVRLFRNRTDYLLIYYWLSPICFYISYIHGQLDVAAMAFCVASLWKLKENRHALSGFLMAAACLCKFHVIILVPFFFSFIWNQLFASRALQALTRWTLAWGLACAVGFLPLIFARRMAYVSFFSPEALRIFSTSFSYGGGQTLYFGVLIVLIVLGRLCASTRISSEGLFFGSGAIFASLLLATHTMPGWYYWVAPFVAALFSLYPSVPRILYWTYSGAYLAYFMVLNGRVPPEWEIVKGVTYTSLQAVLAAILVAMWALIVRRQAVLSGRTQPILLGLSGNSGAGKDRLSLALQDLFTPRNSVILHGDDYHKWERDNERWADYTHLNPRANNLSHMAQDTRILASGASIFSSRYDHQHGIFTGPMRIKPSKTVIVQGLHTLYLRGMRKKFNLKVFLDPHEMVRTAWKLDRDVKERGHSPEKILQTIVRRESDSRLHISPQRDVADWIIEYLPVDENLTTEDLLKGVPIDVWVRHTVWNDESLDDLARALHIHCGCEVRFDTPETNMERIRLGIKGNPTPEQIRTLGELLIPDLRHVTRARRPPTWRAGLDGINQLIAGTLLRNRLTEQWGS